jgi:hypothetical protein
MLRLLSKITFTLKSQPEPLIFDFLNEVEIDLSHNDLTGTAKITIPRKLRFDGKDIAFGINSIFKRGDKVKIELGYYPNKRTVFEGYIAKISINSPIVLECEDDMFILKKKMIIYPKKYSYNNKSKIGITSTFNPNVVDPLRNGFGTTKLANPKNIGTSLTLKRFLEENITGTTDPITGNVTKEFELKCLVDMSIPVNRYDCSAAKVLDKLKEDYDGLFAYFQDGVLVVGFSSDASDSIEVDFAFEETIIDDTNLEYKRKEDILLQVRATSINTITNERIQVTVGDEDGAHRDIFNTNFNNAEDLKKWATGKLEVLKYEGYYGSFKTFGENYVRPGDIANLTSIKYPEKNGKYLILSVKRTFGMNGYRQDIELADRIGFNTTI